MHRKICCFLFCLALILLMFTGCAPSPFSKTIFAMDTVMTLTAYGAKAQEAIEAAVSRLFALDAMLSVTNGKSEIAKLNAAGGADVTVSPEVYRLLEDAVYYSEKFAGYFDVTISPLVSLWGFYTDVFAVPDDTEIAESLTRVDYHFVNLKENLTVSLDGGAQIDLGAIAKGYATEQVRAIFENYGIENALIDLGGNILTLGDKQGASLWRIAVQNPFDSAVQLCTLAVSNKALVTSGSYQRYFEQNDVRYHHIMDPQTGAPAESDLVSVTVITEDALYADALSTSLFVMGFDRAASYWRLSPDFEAVFVMASGEAFCTPGVMEMLVESNVALGQIMQ